MRMDSPVSRLLERMIQRRSSPTCHSCSLTLTIQMPQWSNLMPFVFSRERAMCLHKRSNFTQHVCKFGSWDKLFKKEEGDPMRLLVGDFCKSHFTAISKEKISRKTCFGRVGESCTSLTQYLDADHMQVFEHHYANIFCTEVEPKLKD